MHPHVSYFDNIVIHDMDIDLHIIIYFYDELDIHLSFKIRDKQLYSHIFTFHASYQMFIKYKQRYTMSYIKKYLYSKCVNDDTFSSIFKDEAFIVLMLKYCQESIMHAVIIMGL